MALWKYNKLSAMLVTRDRCQVLAEFTMNSDKLSEVSSVWRKVSGRGESRIVRDVNYCYLIIRMADALEAN